MKRLVGTLSALVASGLFISLVSSSIWGVKQNATEIEEGPTPWTDLEFNDNPRQFNFAVISDLTGGYRRGVLEEATKNLNLLQPSFVISVGDLIEGYTRKKEFIDYAWNYFDEKIQTLEMPFFRVPGNHDLSNEVLVREWKSRFGRTYYHFVYKGALFLALNSAETIKGRLGSDQLEYFQKILAANQDVRWTFVFLHHPLWRYEGETGWKVLESLLQNRPYTVISGHAHRYFHERRKGRDYFVLGTTGGGSRLRGPEFGEFDHLLWVTMKEEPQVANLMHDGIQGIGIRTSTTDSFFSTLLQEEAFVVKPIVLSNEVFENAETEVQVSNGAPVEMQVIVYVKPHNQVKVSPDRLELILPPDSIQETKIRVSSEAPLEISRTQPVQIHWRAHFELPEAGSLQKRGIVQCYFDTLARIVPKSEPLKVDGDLSEWPPLPVAGDVPAEIGKTAGRHFWSGPRDASFRLGTLHDGKFLYLGIQVVDDEVVLIPDVKHWEQDGIEVFLETLPNGDVRSKQLYLGISPPLSPDQTTYVDEENELPEELIVTSRLNPSGHSTEIAVPLSEIGLGNIKSSSLRFRLNIGLIDLDSKEWPIRLYWRPKWDSPRHFENSGQFSLRR